MAVSCVSLEVFFRSNIGIDSKGNLTGGTGRLVRVTKDGANVSIILKDLLKGGLTKVVNRFLIDSKNAVISKIKENLDSGGPWKPWSEKYVAWRDLSRARGINIVGNKIHTATGSFNRNLRRMLNLEIEKDSKNIIGFLDTGFILELRIGKRDTGRFGTARKFKQAQLGWPEGHSTGAAVARNVRGMLIPLTKRDASSKEKYMPVKLYKGLPVLELDKTALRRTDPIPARPLITEQEISFIISDNSKKLKNYVSRMFTR